MMGALESRGVLRRMSDMLELLMKRMDILARLENGTDFHKGDEARFPLDRSVGGTDAPMHSCCPQNHELGGFVEGLPCPAPWGGAGKSQPCWPSSSTQCCWFCSYGVVGDPLGV